MSTVIVRMRVKPDMENRFLEIFHEVVQKMKRSEPQTRVYAVWKTQQEHEYLLVESYTSQSGRELHERQHTGVFTEFMSCLASPPETEVLGDFVLGVPDETCLPIQQSD